MTSRLLRRVTHGFCQQNNKPPSTPPPPIQASKVSLRDEYKRLVMLGKPESYRYIRNILLTGAHACCFMYLPNIYPDIAYLQSVKLGPETGAFVAQEYTRILAKWALLFGTTGALTYARRFDFIDLSNRISVRLRAVLYGQVLQKDIYKRSTSAQAYLHHLTTDIKAVGEFMGETIFHGLRGALFLVGGAFSLIYTAPYLSISAIAIMACFNYVFKRKNLVLRGLKAAENEALKHTSEYASQRFANSKLIKISDTRHLERIRYLKELTTFYELSKKVAKANGLNYGMLEGLGLISLFAVAASGALMISLNLADFNLLTSSTYALYVAMGFRSVINFNTEMGKVMGVFSNFEKKIGDLSTNPQYNGPFPLDVIELEEKQLMEEFSHASEFRHELKYELEFRGIEFGFASRPNLLKDFNLIIPSGKFVAVTGPSGVGKSTVLNLLAGLYEPRKGQILFNGVELAGMPNRTRFIQQTISYVTQDSFVFSGSIYSNLIYGNQGSDVSQQNCIKCLKLAQAYDFVMAKGGIHAKVREKGSNFSGGEKQRLLLARALVKQPKILVLDEATANVDKESELKIFENIKQLSQKNGMTCLIISHKLDLIKDFIDINIDFETING